MHVDLFRQTYCQTVDLLRSFSASGIRNNNDLPTLSGLGPHFPLGWTVLDILSNFKMILVMSSADSCVQVF